MPLRTFERTTRHPTSPTLSLPSRIGILDRARAFRASQTTAVGATETLYVSSTLINVYLPTGDMIQPMCKALRKAIEGLNSGYNSFECGEYEAPAALRRQANILCERDAEMDDNDLDGFPGDDSSRILIVWAALTRSQICEKAEPSERGGGSTSRIPARSRGS